MQDYLINVCGDISNASWLIKGDANILYDPGMAYSAEHLIANIKHEIGDKPLDAVILSHSHYDHVAALPYIKKEWPDCVVYGSAYAAKILEKPTARETMRSLSVEAARGAGISELPPYDEALLKIERPVYDGDVISIGEHTIQVYETPGHTRCSVSYLVDHDVLLLSETVGVFKGKGYMPCYLVGHQMALDSVEKLRRVPARRFFISHLGVQDVEDANVFWSFLHDNLISTKKEILEILQTYATREEQLHVMQKRFHDHIFNENEQPSSAFRMNAEAMLNLIARECLQ